MDVIEAVREYIKKITDIKGMKVLLVDKHTTGIISVVYSQTEILQREVYLVDKLEKKGREKFPNLIAVCFIKPTVESIQDLADELRDPKYKEYYIYLNNITRVVHIEKLAESDRESLVQQVFEYFADYYAVNNDLFSLNIRNCIGDHLNTWDQSKLERVTEGLISVLLSLKKRPVIRYEKSSDLAKRLGNEVHYIMNQQESSLFSFKQPDVPPLLLILDRRNDPVTPLLNQWTYQAMIHELFGINNNLVTPPEKAGPDFKDIVLSSNQDQFYRDNMFLNFGDLGANIKSYVEEYQRQSQSNRKIETIAEMKKFVEDYPQFKKLAGNVTKHVTLVSELSRIVDSEQLLDVSEVEQELAVNEDHAQTVRSIQALLSNPKISHFNKVRLVLLYTLRYEKSQTSEFQSSKAQLIDKLSAQGIDKTFWIASILKYAGYQQRQGDLFQNESIFSRGKNVLKKGLKGVENIYTQHTPLLMRTLEDLFRGKLRDNLYPFIENSISQNLRAQHRPQDVIVFIIGGATYEEAKFVSELNKNGLPGGMGATSGALTGMRVVLGGTSVINSNMFLEDMEETMKRVK